MAGELILISDEQAKLGTKALELLQDFGGFLREILGTVPEDVVGLLGGDWLKFRRAKNLADMLATAREKIEKSGVKETQEVPLTLALPMLRAAADESRAELQDLWARLLATAMDPARANTVRQSFINAVKEFDPLDARLFKRLNTMGSAQVANWHQILGAELHATPDEIEISADNLERIGCITKHPGRQPPITSFGRELMRALSA
jgi:hypothetical protein